MNYNEIPDDGDNDDEITAADLNGPETLLLNAVAMSLVRLPTAMANCLDMYALSYSTAEPEAREAVRKRALEEGAKTLADSFDATESLIGALPPKARKLFIQSLRSAAQSMQLHG